MLNLIVLTGGSGLEHSVSINSANNFIKNIDLDIFKIFLVFISKSGEWFYNNHSCCISKEDNEFYLLVNYNKKIKVDLIFPIIHGKGVENGEIQGFFESVGFQRLVSNSLQSSCFSFDKVISKKIAKSLNIPVTPYLDLASNFYNFNDASKVLESESLFLKPADNGSSFGCKRVFNEHEFNLSLSEILKITKYPIVEKYIDAIECSCSVLYGEVSEVICINHNLDFFSYEAKYLDHEFKVNFLRDDFLVNKIKNYSIHLFKEMRLSLFCRFDFFINKKNNEVYFNEANSLPGLGSESLFFSSFSCQYSIKELIGKIFNPWVEKKTYN